jgi:5-methylcytosine-specific restriction endonuclease McrA
MATNTLDSSVLVLNRHWAPVHITSAYRALVLLHGDHARVVSEDYATHDFTSWRELSQFLETHRKISTPNYQLAVPEVIMLTRYGKFPPRQVKFSRRNIFQRDGYRCQYCGCVPAKDSLTIDHVVPRSKGGKTTWDNIVLACLKCNMRKGDKTPAEVGLKLLSQPVRPHWLSCSTIGATPPTASGLWQRFVDEAYWNSTLED